MSLIVNDLPSQCFQVHSSGDVANLTVTKPDTKEWFLVLLTEVLVIKNTKSNLKQASAQCDVYSREGMQGRMSDKPEPAMRGLVVPLEVVRKWSSAKSHFFYFLRSTE